MENKNISENNIDLLTELENLIDDAKEENILENEEIIVEPLSLELLEEEDNLEKSILENQDFFQEKEKNNTIEEIKEHKGSKFLSGLWFTLRYMLTTSLIFGVLLVSTNYQAYYNIAMSYINAEELENKSRGLISSVEASNITEKIQNDIEAKKEIIENDQEEVRTKNSVKHLLEISEANGTWVDIEITPYQNRIIIPKIGKNIPLVDIKNRALDDSNELNNIFMKELEKGVIRYPGSWVPGKDGNAFVFGHSSNFPWIKWDYNDVFALLDNVGFDDEIIVYYNQKKYKYIVREKNVITPGDTSVLNRDKNKSEITLMTCWPIGTTLNRLIVTGELVEEL